MKYEYFLRRNWLGKKQWYWHLKAANHKIIADGEGYNNRADCLAMIELIRGKNVEIPIVCLS